jgi:DDE superfamily endonuclease
MPQGVTLPGTLSGVLGVFRSCLAKPTCAVFTALVAGLFAQPVSRTVCGMLTGAGLARFWHHCRAHRFFSAARWCPRQVGLLLAELMATRLLPAGAPVTVVVDDTVFRRRGKKVHGVGWWHDGSAAGQTKLGFGNTWVVVAIIVTLPCVSRPVALPVLAALAVKGGQSKPELARDLVDLIAERFGDREVHIVGDAAYGCGAFIGLGEGMSMTTRAKATAVFHHLAPPRTGTRGRPHRKGQRIGTPAQIATDAT